MNQLIYFICTYVFHTQRVLIISFFAAMRLCRASVRPLASAHCHDFLGFFGLFLIFIFIFSRAIDFHPCGSGTKTTQVSFCLYPVDYIFTVKNNKDQAAWAAKTPVFRLTFSASTILFTFLFRICSVLRFLYDLMIASIPSHSNLFLLYLPTVWCI